MTRRMDMITAVTRLLLDNSTFSEAVTLQRCARLLAGDIASWVIIDVERADLLRRQFVIGPHDEAAGGTGQEDAGRGPAARLGARAGPLHGHGRWCWPTRTTPGMLGITARTGRRCWCCSARPR
jgi:hypothetical protein